MSLIREVIEANSLVTISSLLNELPQLVEESESLSKATKKYIDDVYIKFNRARPVDYFQESQKLISKADNVRSRVQEVIDTEVDTTKNEVNKCQALLKNVDENLCLCYPVNRCHDKIQCMQRCIESKAYIEAVELMLELNAIDSSSHSKIMDVLKVEAMNKKSHLISVMEKAVSDNIKITSTSASNSNTSTLTFTTHQNEKMQELLTALSKLNESLIPLNMLAQFLLQMICNVIPNGATIDLSDNTLILKSETARGGKVAEEWDVRSCFTNLIVLSKFVFENLSYSFGKDLHVMDYIRNQCEDIPSLLIKRYLDRATPTTESQLSRYDDVKVQVDSLQSMLISVKLLPPNCTELTDYTSEITTHYADKKCNRYRAQADALIKKDLSNITIVGTEYKPEGLSCDGFSQCAISSSVLELLQLVNSIFHQAQGCSDGTAGFYVTTAASILDSYHDNVAVCHENLLLTIPKQTAIFYNNCKYLAHHITTPEWQYILGHINGILADFTGVDCIVQRLNNAAEEMLEKYIQEQIDTIKTRVKDIRIDPATEKLDDDLEKKMRQCLRHMELLKTVWQKVLSYFDYNSSIGRLLNALSADIIEAILQIDDIPVDVVDQLVDILKVIITRGPKLLTEPNEVRMYVQSWEKLSELLFVLTSRLVFIVDRWAEGKGPLALHFTADEMRKLIRALFQNSDLRADVLKRIH